MAFKMKGDPYKMGKIATKSAMEMKTSYKMKEAMAKTKSPMEAAKPDYPDIDGDGNTTESMKQAAADKKSGAKMKKKEPMTMKKEATKIQSIEDRPAPLKQDKTKTKNKKRKLSVLDKLSAASRAISTSEGPFGDTNFVDRYKEAKRGIRKTGRRSKDALMGSNR